MYSTNKPKRSRDSKDSAHKRAKRHRSKKSKVYGLLENTSSKKAFRTRQGVLKLANVSLCMVLFAGSCTSELAQKPTHKESVNTAQPTAPDSTAAPEVVTPPQTLNIELRRTDSSHLSTFKRVIRTHPSKLIHSDLYQRLMKREIVLNFQFKQSGVMASAGLSFFPILGKRLVLNIDPEYLDDSPINVRRTWEIVFHEYQHFLQYDRGELLEIDLVRNKTKGVVVFGQERMTRMFRCEIAAYKEQCDFATRHGWNSAHPYCLRYNEDGMSGLVRSYTASQLLSPDIAPSDKRFIAQLYNDFEF